MGKALLFWLRIDRKYQRIINSENRDTSVKLGVESLLLSIFGLLCTAGFACLGVMCFTQGWVSLLLGFLFGIPLIVAAVGCYIEMSIASIVYAAYQLRVNKRAIGIVALIISILLVIGAIGAIILVLSLAS